MSLQADIQAAKERTAEKKQEKLFQGRIISVHREVITFPEGTSIVSDVVIHPGAVAIIPVMDTGEILCIKQWRRAIQKVIIEIPAGTLEEGEPPLLCAQRELQEEIGYKAAELIALGGFYTTPGFCTEYLHIFLGKGLIRSPLVGEDSHEIDPFPLTLDKALDMIVSGEINDAKTIAALGLYERYLR